MAAPPGSIANAVVRGFCLPHAKTTLMFGNEDNVLGSETDCGSRPLVGIQSLRVNLGERRGQIIRFHILPGIRRKMYKHSHLEILPSDLIRGRQSARGGFQGCAPCLAHATSQSSRHYPTQSSRRRSLYGSENHLTSLHKSHLV